ncbi:MAG: pyruvate kinase [Eubacteriales bacterium]|nr:pyruvate kinase [Eubacteriales bacterium]
MATNKYNPADFRRTKIVCTIGPACDNEETLTKMFKAGMSVGRFNFSHGTHAEHAKTMEMFRSVRDSLGTSAALMLDTRGPEIRLKDFKNGGCELRDGASFTLTTKLVEGTELAASITYPKLPNDVKIGDYILVDDGKIILQVEATTATDIRTKVIHGGFVKDHKGINVPEVTFSMPYLSEQDKSDLLFGIEQDVDYVAASFASTAQDMIDLRNFLDEHGGNDIKIIAKIESSSGIQNFNKILEVVDGIMIARGDMGVEIAYERLPWVQKNITEKCMAEGKIVITATQMLESMVTSPIPTRAEVTDVANAVFNGSSAVMLSEETAAGNYPVEAVAAMAKIATQAEFDMMDDPEVINFSRPTDDDVSTAVGHAACTLAEDIHAAAIVAVTKNGVTAARTAKFHPEVPIIGITPNEKTYQQLSLVWGVKPMMSVEETKVLEIFRKCADNIVNENLAPAGSKLVILAGPMMLCV